MASIKGIEGLSHDEVNHALAQGARFVTFSYTISIIVMTFKRSSDVYFIKPGDGTFGKSFGFTLISLLFGWWGIPWGPIYTIGSLFNNLTGGKDITPSVANQLGLELPR